MRCLTSAKFNMTATVLREGGATNDPTGHWETQQDPDSGAFIRVWVTDSDPVTPGAQGEETFPCMVRGILSGGIRVAGSTQRISDIYENVEWANIEYPSSVVLRKNDRITNIKGSDGTVIWREEEIEDAPPTVFVIQGVTPIVDPFARNSENSALMQRAEVQ